jgi:hypothetical protein
MPCFDGGYGNESGLNTHDIRLIIKQEHAEQQKHEKEVHKDLFDSFATPLLCEAMDIIEQGGLLKKCSPTLREWYKKHTADDIERLKQVEPDDFETIDNFDERERRLYEKIKSPTKKRNKN